MMLNITFFSYEKKTSKLFYLNENIESFALLIKSNTRSYIDKTSNDSNIETQITFIMKVKQGHFISKLNG